MFKSSIALSLFIFICSIVIAQKPRPIQLLENRLTEDEKIEWHFEGYNRINTITNKPIALYSEGYSVVGDSPEEKAKHYLQNNANKLGLNYSDMRDLYHHATRSSISGDVVRYRQHLNGVPVNESEVTISISPKSTVEMVVSSYQSDLEIENSEPSISEASAIKTAWDYIKPEALMMEEESHLMIYKSNTQTRLAYEVMILADQPLGEWHVFIDALSGDIFKVQDELHYYCKQHNKHNKCNHKDHNEPPKKEKNPKAKSVMVAVDGTGLTFDPDPLSSNMVAYGGNYSDNSDATNIDLDNARFSRTLRDIDLTAGIYKLSGPWADISDHSTPNKGLFTQATSSFNFNREEDGFEAANCYYHVDSLMRYINITLGLNITPFQYAGGVKFDPSGANGADNSFYSGASGTITFGEGGVDDAEDSDVVHHELGHFLHDMVTSGGLSQVNGLSEGCGDYVAQSYNRSLGNWASADPAYNWVFNWDGHNPFWSGRITNRSEIYPTGLVGQVHADGTLWSTSMMLVWDLLGRDATDIIFYEGLGMTNGASNQDDAANAVFQAAINLNYTPTQLQDIHTTLTNRGYTLPPHALFSESETNICIDNTMTIDFVDESIITSPITTWAWAFEGGTPATSTAQNPTVTYTTEGIFDVTLSVTNSNGTDDLVMTDHITITQGINCTPDCVPDLYVADPVTGVYTAFNILSSDGIVIPTNNVIFKSQTTIDLSSGFEVQLNAEFIAEIADCPN